MAAITYSDMLARKDTVMRQNQEAVVIIAKPDATSDATSGVYLVKEPRGGTGTTSTTTRGNALDGWKEYSHADLGTAYGL